MSKRSKRQSKKSKRSKRKQVLTIDTILRTRVPVRALLDYIEGGETLDEFLEQYPTVSRKQAIGFLE